MTEIGAGNREAVRAPPGRLPPGEDELLRREAALLARYVLGREPAPESLDRYRHGCRCLFRDVAPGDEAVIRFALRHPWSLPLLDAASGLVAPDSLLRRKLFLMLAVLEADPRSIEAFEPVRAPRALIVLRIFARAAAAGLKAAAGLGVLPLARRAR